MPDTPKPWDSEDTKIAWALSEFARLAREIAELRAEIKKLKREVRRNR